MKNISTIRVGDYEIAIAAERLEGHVVKFIATCKDQRIESCMTLMGDHTFTPEEFRKSIEDHARIVAKEAAAKAHRESLLKTIFTET